MTFVKSGDERPRVLVVEDEYFIADDLAQALAAEGAEVIGPVGDPREALDLVANERIDRAVLDINLHGELVFDVARALQARDIPFVFATGYAANVVPSGLSHVPRWEKPFDAISLARWLATGVAA
ncbi:response regulator [Salinarimonas ramus]|uniref:Response regulator n=1 Tax=Salinarimonas ramus TaxID=690164 RepID=A0A917V5U8_9HYPH|nr:response regulator [Salinarimonas ramus]GGK44294.1 response regulator [Salinarimonas ramus]